MTLIKNKRGVYCLDTTIGCNSGTIKNEKGCYDDCYAARFSKRRGWDFGKTIARNFESREHKKNTIKKINDIEMPFVRIGCTGDPSENWQHTVNICEQISVCNNQLSVFGVLPKTIVIITKHFKNLTDDQLKTISELDICVNTSVSALDNERLLINRLTQYNRLKKYCKSVLRIVSCDFNLNNRAGQKLEALQQKLFSNENVLDTVLRVSKENKYVLAGIINIKETKFLGKKCYASVYNKKTYLGYCSKCKEMCGVNFKQ